MKVKMRRWKSVCLKDEEGLQMFNANSSIVKLFLWVLGKSQLLKLSHNGHVKWLFNTRKWPKNPSPKPTIQIHIKSKIFQLFLAIKHDLYEFLKVSKYLPRDFSFFHEIHHFYYEVFFSLLRFPESWFSWELRTWRGNLLWSSQEFIEKKGRLNKISEISVRFRKLH